MVWYILSNIGKSVGLKSLSGHSLRKYWSLMARLNGVSMEIIQHKLNHSSLANTQKYLWITNDEIMDACNKLDL
jgi:site-specific recombinase XerD